MKTDGLKQLPGKTVLGVVVKERKSLQGSLSMQIHIVFTDQTSIEFYTSGNAAISIANRLDDGGLKEALDYCSGSMRPVYQVYTDAGGRVVEEKDAKMRE
jgi:hypothetical protein